MARRAAFSISIDGTNITSVLSPLLLSLTVTDKAGTHGDTVNLRIDDTDGRVVMPRTGARVTVALGWQGGGVRQVFEGTVDEVLSSGTAASGRALTITAKGFDATGKAKEGQQRHWDDATVREILEEAGEDAGIAQVDIDPDLEEVELAYFEMRDESYLHMGERLAHEIGGNFRIRGETAIMSRRGGEYAPLVTASWGVNLHAWDISPSIGRFRFGAARSRWYDAEEGEWKEIEVETGIDSDAVFVDRVPRASEAEAQQQAEADADTIKRDSGGGMIVMEGSTAAVPDGICVVAGARPGIDGAYQIETVIHTMSADGGWTTALELKRPDGVEDGR